MIAITCPGVRLRGSNGGSGNTGTPVDGFPVANSPGACALTQVVNPDSDATWLLTVAHPGGEPRQRRNMVVDSGRSQPLCEATLPVDHVTAAYCRNPLMPVHVDEESPEPVEM